MMEIPLIHGKVWINPDCIVSIETNIDGCFLALQSGGYNSPLAPEELAARIKLYKATHRVA